jgi:small subunit ribosomal protein S4e
MHLKRQKAPKNWPIKRKGTAYIVKPNSNLSAGIPVLIAIRDMLKLAQNRKEVKKILHMKNLLLNGTPVKDEKNSITLFDIITIVPSNENYRLSLTKKGKFQIEKIKSDESLVKIAKVINKKVLKGKKIQLNLSDGRNFLSDIKCNVNDSVLIDLKKKKIEKCLTLKEKGTALVFAGKHSGKEGLIEKIKPERKMASVIVTETKDKINVLIKQLMVLSVGGTAEELEKGFKLLGILTGKKPAKTRSKKRIPTWGVRPKLEVGAVVTLRRNFEELLKKLLVTIDNSLKKKQVSENNFSFGIKEYIEIPGVEYQREIGIRGFDVTVVFKRNGRRVRLKKIKKGKIPKRQAITKEEIIKFMGEKFGTEFE